MAKESKPRASKKEASSTAKKPAKKDKDPNAPKRPLSAYMIFSQSARQQVKDDNPDASFGDLGKLLGAKWKDMDEEARKPFTKQAEEQKTRYEKEKTEYEAKKPAAKEETKDEEEEDDD